MKNNVFLNKILPLLSIVLLFSFIFINNNIFAACIDTNYDYLYNYNNITNSNIDSQVQNIINDERVVSGEYYYFCYYNTGDKSYMTVLIPKNVVTTNSFRFLNFYQDSEKCQSFGLFLSNDKIENSVIRVSGVKGYDNVNSFNLWVGGYYDEANKCFNIPFASNFDKDIIYNCSNGDIKPFFQVPPVVETPEITTPEVEIPALETVEQIPEAMKETMKVVIPVGLVILGIGLVVYLIKFVKSQML